MPREANATHEDEKRGTGKNSVARTSGNKRRPGRPSKLTPDVVALILNAIRCGAPNKVACAAAGIRAETMCVWLRKAEELGKPKEYAQFAQSLARARQEGIAARLGIIHKAAKIDWRAAAWLLERDMPDVFSLRFRIEHTVAPSNLGDVIASLREDRQQPPMIDVEARDA
jgi:hypothetical protein